MKLSLFECIDVIPDPRYARGVRHKVSTILKMVTLGFACRLVAVEHIVNFFRPLSSLLGPELGSDRIQPPDPTTVHRVLESVDRSQFENAFRCWVGSLVKDENITAAVDGKALINSGCQKVLNVFWHAHPIPCMKDIGMAYGYILENGTLSGYKPSWECDEAQYFKMEDRPLYNGNTILYYINGMNNPLEDAKKQVLKFSDDLGGCRVDLFYNPTRGTVRSLVDTLVDKCNIHLQTANMAISSLRDVVKESQGIENGQVLGLGFSQGGQLLHTAVSALSAEERSYTHAFTLGSAKIIEDMGLKSYGNFISTSDPIPFFVNLNYTSARCGYVDGVTFIPSASDHFFDHTVFSPTYEIAFKRIRSSFETGKSK